MSQTILPFPTNQPQALAGKARDSTIYRLMAFEWQKFLSRMRVIASAPRGQTLNSLPASRHSWWPPSISTSRLCLGLARRQEVVCATPASIPCTCRSAQGQTQTSGQQIV
jgi:hypothetical protein